MTYSTGSGSYTDMMAAVLSHAVTDGWTEVGGIGTGWPISNGGMYVDWTSYTAIETDATAGVGGSKTQRYLKIGISSASGAAATSRAAATTNVIVPNAAYDITGYHIFSDPSVSDYIHVVFVFSNGIDSNVCSHFSFGFIDPLGMSHGGVMYATSRNARGYAVSNVSGDINGGDWNTLNRTGQIFAGAIGDDSDGTSNIEFIIPTTDAPTPNGTAGWPSHDTIVGGGDKLWGKIGTVGLDTSDIEPTGSNNGNYGPNAIGWGFGAQPYSGGVSLLNLPFYAINGSLSSSKMRLLGQFPNVRTCSMQGLNPGNEISFGSDTWKVFPLLCKKDNATLGDANAVTSGQAGLAYKKVS